MSINWKRLLLCLACPLAVGGAAALLTAGSMADFAQLAQPPLTPPDWLFPLVWTALYLLMGLASYLVLQRGQPRWQVRSALLLYGGQLFFNFCWPLLFFRLGAYLLAFIWLVVLWLLILAVLLRFGRLVRAAGWLLLPYLLWVAFAGYLNLGVWLLN